MFLLKAYKLSNNLIYKTLAFQNKPLNKNIKVLVNVSFSMVLLLALANGANGQTLARTSVDSQGETLTKPQISITYVIGEADGELLFNGSMNKRLTTGFIQPDVEISQVLAGSARSLTLYPNPSDGAVKLAFHQVPDGPYNVNIFDASGRLLQTQQVNYSSQSVSSFPLEVSQYPPGTYFIQVVNPKKFQGEVKLVKY